MTTTPSYYYIKYRGRDGGPYFVAHRPSINERYRFYEAIGASWETDVWTFVRVTSMDDFYKNYLIRYPSTDNWPKLSHRDNRFTLVTEDEFYEHYIAKKAGYGDN